MDLMDQKIKHEELWGAEPNATECVIAPISIPIGVISLTGGTLAIYLTACLLGGLKGTASVLVYLLVGFAGLPVFDQIKGDEGVHAGRQSRPQPHLGLDAVPGGAEGVQHGGAQHQSCQLHPGSMSASSPCAG